jgi:hypothetical protein
MIEEEDISRARWKDGSPDGYLAAFLQAKAERFRADALLMQTKSSETGDASRVREYLRERRDALLMAGDFQQGSLLRGNGNSLSVDTYLLLLRQLLDADAAVAAKAKDRERACEDHLNRAKTCEDLVKQRVEAGMRGITLVDGLLAKAARLEAEVLLLRAQAASRE